MRCESALARLYCRMALLNIFAPKNPHTFTRLFHIPAVRDITLEHLQLLSNQLLAPPLPGQCSLVECAGRIICFGHLTRLLSDQSGLLFLAWGPDAVTPPESLA